MISPWGGNEPIKLNQWKCLSGTPFRWKEIIANRGVVFIMGYKEDNLQNLLWVVEGVTVGVERDN